MIPKKSGMMVILSSPSGAGKTTLSKMIVKKTPNFVISISHTTRKPRPNEKEGKEYYFVNKNQFTDLVKSESFFEYANIFGNYYGTLKKPVLSFTSLGKNVVFDIDWQGTQQLKKKVRDLKLVTIFILPPNVNTLKSRLVNRDQDGKLLAETRMKLFKEEVSHWKEYDYVVINKDLNTCYEKISSIIDSEKMGKKYNFDIKEIENTVSELIK